MKANVFIVNDSTFPSHLKYQFAGTGAKEKDNDIYLLADIKRVRGGDYVIFYIEATTKVKGGFYGIFKVAEQNPIIFNTTGSAGIQPGLGKKLIYRTLFEPYEVYSEGVPEWEALDKLPTYAADVQWSLIYRKLKGKRGCTQLLPWESKTLLNMIRSKNSGVPVANTAFTGGFDWDIKNRKIITTTSKKPYPYDRNYNYNVIADICDLQKRRRAYEGHLQMYFTENMGNNPNLTQIVGDNIVWFGNEVACGTGMQKIDVMTISGESDEKVYRIVELKDEAVELGVVEQLEYYANWASQNNGKHLEGAFSWNIQPVVVAPPHAYKNWQQVKVAFSDFNAKAISMPIQYFEFVVQCGQRIIFSQVDY